MIKALKNFFILFVICSTIIVSGCGKSDETDKESTETEQTTSATSEVEEKNLTREEFNLGMTPEEFKLMYNKFAENQGVSKNLIGDINIETGTSQSIAQMYLSETLVMQLNISKNSGFVTGIWILSQPQTEEDFSDMVTTYGLVISLLNPELNEKERENLLLDLKLTTETKDELNENDATAERSITTYMVTKLDTQTYFLTAAPKYY